MRPAPPEGASASTTPAAPHPPSLGWPSLPPLMVYLAAGLSGLTGIVGSFYVKEHLGLSAEFLAALGFWAGLPWSLKMALGHVVDLVWRHKAGLVVLGAALVAVSLAIMLGLLASRDAMLAWATAEAWYVAATLLAPIGYVLQDVVADAMTVEAVPQFDTQGRPLSQARLKLLHTRMQSLSRGTLIAGSVLVSLVNLALFQGVEGWSAAQRVVAYQQVYGLALAVPLLSVAGVALAGLLRRRRPGLIAEADASRARPRADPAVLGGGIAFALLAAGLGLSGVPHAEWLVFAASLAIVAALMRKLLAALAPADRRTLLGTALALFVFRAMPDPGPAATWWMIDKLGVDEAFMAMLSLIGGLLALAGLWLFRRFMAERSVGFTIVLLSLGWTLLSLPSLGLYYGLHEWAAAHTGGLIDGRVIVVADTSLLSLLSEIAMVPMLAWVARTAPDHLKATYFAVMISFTNLGLSLSRLGSEYLNGVYVVTREVPASAGGAVAVAADYSQLGPLTLATMACVLVLPPLAVWALRRSRFPAA